MDLDFLGPFNINKYIHIYLIKKTENPTANNVHLIYRNRNIETPEREEDDQDGQARVEGGQYGQNIVK